MPLSRNGHRRNRQRVHDARREIGVVMTTDFGQDTFCLDSRRTGRMARGVTLVAQRCYHRLITPRGQLRGGEDEANFGYDLGKLIGRSNLSDSQIEGEIKNELSKEEAVESVAVMVTRSSGAVFVSYSIQVDCVTAEGPFSLVLAVSDVTVELVGLTVGAT
jgi:hypothetical protein